MSNYFKEISQNSKKMETKLLGPDYKYYKNIKTPKEMGMSSKGTLGTLSNDIAGIISYSDVLVTGRGNASKTGKPLGTKFFLKTGGQCKEQGTGKLVDRYMYIDNVPDGKIPFISSGMDMEFTDFEGLIPGILSDTAKINPMGIFKSFMQDSEPACKEITRETIDVKNKVSKESRHVPLDEIKKNYKEAFSKENSIFSTENTYLLVVGILFLYLLSKLYYKNVKIL